MDKHALKQLAIFFAMLVSYYLATQLPVVITRPGSHDGLSMQDAAAALLAAELDRGLAGVMGILV